MRAVFMMFDSLNRHALGCYGGTRVPTPNFDRFAERSLTFDNHFVGSLPCMPARRDLHTGRLSFMHRSWGPLEPFDNSFPAILKKNGVYTHLITDHFHYFEDGGSTYHNRYNSWELERGQEYDTWKARVAPETDRYGKDYSDKHYNAPGEFKRLQHQVNRDAIVEEADHPGPRCFARAFEFLDANRAADDWLLQLECFDPHEPFFAPEAYRKQFPTDYTGPVLDWPKYGRVDDTPQEIAEINANYEALLSMCDAYFGKLLDYFDAHDLWKDTALILSTDHGFLLSEHALWGKNMMPYYDQLSRIPLMIHHPGWTDRAGTRSDAVTQTPDLMPTILELFGCETPPETCARPLSELMEDAEAETGRTVIFGQFGGPIGATDGRWRLYLYPPDLDDENLWEYTLMPTHLKGFFSLDELATAEPHPPLPFTKGAPVMRYRALRSAAKAPGPDRGVFKSFGTALYDIEADPEQQNPVEEPEVMARLRAAVVQELRRHDATGEFLQWMGLADVQPQDTSGRNP